ncbi:MAG TPA: 6-phosphogluconolactonase, partial [Candidatus Saccharimonadales bacterium]|nr:6-phosphogluconolactonase [Candidatus Saccharimonadales bacterium]
TAAAAESIARAGRFTVALAGGSTPRRLYTLLAEAAAGQAPAWGRIHIFWGDERHVPPDHAQSNYRMVRETLLDRISIPEGNVHRVLAETADAEAAARDYEREIRRFFGCGEEGIPSIDLVLLGLGTDGHTASLFPGSPLLDESRRLVAAAPASVPGPDRISMTLPLINRAASIVFLVSGASKADAVRRVLATDGDADPLPARRVAPRDGRLLWLVDEEAAERIG